MRPAPAQACASHDYGTTEIKDLPREKLIELLGFTCPLLLKQFETYRLLCDRIDVAVSLLAKGRAGDAATVLSETTMIWRSNGTIQ